MTSPPLPAMAATVYNVTACLIRRTDGVCIRERLVPPAAVFARDISAIARMRCARRQAQASLAAGSMPARSSLIQKQRGEHVTDRPTADDVAGDDDGDAAAAAVCSSSSSSVSTWAATTNCAPVFRRLNNPQRCSWRCGTVRMQPTQTNRTSCSLRSRNT